MFSKNLSKLSKIVKIVNYFQNFQKLSKNVKLSKLSKIVFIEHVQCTHFTYIRKLYTFDLYRKRESKQGQGEFNQKTPSYKVDANKRILFRKLYNCCYKTK